MPYYRKRKNFRAKKRFNKKGGSWLGYAKKALRVANFVKSVVNVEYKYLDVSNTGLSMSSSGAVALLTGLAVGTTSTTRNGNSILMKSFYSQITFKVNAAATSSTLCRVIYFIDKQDTSSLPAVTDVLSAATVNAPIRRDQGDRFIVLYDRRLVVNLDSGSRPAGILKYFKKLHMHVKYLGDTAAQSDTGENQIYVLTVTDAASNNPTFNHTVRMRYIDN